MRAQPGYKKGPQGTPALARMLPYKRQVRHLEDDYENRDGRYGYCFCGCGEKTNIPNYTHAQKGRFAGEPNTFVQGHAARMQKRPRRLSDEQVEQVRWLWQNSPMTSREIGEMVGISGSFTGAIARNEKYYDPDYTPISGKERLRIVCAKVERECPICGEKFWIGQFKLKSRQKVTCWSEECVLEMRRIIARANRKKEWSEEDRENLRQRMKVNREAGRYDNIARPKTRLQEKWEGKLPEEKPDYLDERFWQAIVLHVIDGISYEECSRRFGGSDHLYQYRAKRADEDLERGGPRLVDNSRKKAAAKRRWRNQRGEFS